MTTNLETIGTLNQSMFILSLGEKTAMCGIVWDQTAPGQYHAALTPYDLYLSQIAPGVAVLDVSQYGVPYLSFNSSTVPDVADLYNGVAAVMGQPTKLRAINDFMDRVETCFDKTFNEYGSGAVLAGGKAGVDETQLFLPHTLTFGATSFPWTGAVANIQDAPGVTANDADATFIRQQVHGTGPTEWGDAIVGFDVASFTLLPPYTFRVRVVARCEALTGVSVNIKLKANGLQVGPTLTVGTATTYNIAASSFLPMTGVTAITTLQVVLDTFTNAADNLNRALRVTAVDLAVNGLTA